MKHHQRCIHRTSEQIPVFAIHDIQFRQIVRTQLYEKPGKSITRFVDNNTEEPISRADRTSNRVHVANFQSQMNSESPYLNSANR